VQSFTDPAKIYWVQAVNVANNRLHSGKYSAITFCTCPQHALHKLCCKHMYLVFWLTGYPFKIAPASTHHPAPILASAVTSTSAGSMANGLHLQKQVQAKQIARDELCTTLKHVEQPVQMDKDGIGRTNLQRLETLATGICCKTSSVSWLERVYEFNMN
jgi:hypothetical protein